MNKLLQLTLAGLVASYSYLPAIVSAESQIPAPSPTTDESVPSNDSAETQPPDNATKPLSDDSTVDSEPTAADNQDSGESPSNNSTPSEPPAGENQQPDESSENVESSDDIVGFTLQNRINDGSPQPVITIESDPKKLLDVIKESFQSQVQKYSKPMQINTELKVLLSEKMKETIQEFPTLFIRTNISKEGNGKSAFKIPSWRKEVSARADHKEGVIDWKGLTGNFEFTEKFDHIISDVNAAGLSIEEREEFNFSFEKLALSMELDADLMPTKMKFSLPSIKGGDTEAQLSMLGLAMDMSVFDSGNGVQLGVGEFKMPHFSMDKDGTQLLLKDLSIKSTGEGKGDVVNFNIHTEIAKLFIPKEITEAESLDITYVGDVVFRNLDAASVGDLQQTVRRLRREGTLTEEMMGIVLMGKLMEVAPKLLAKSPEIGIAQLNIAIPEGKLQGDINFRIDGKKPVSFQDPMTILAALEAQAEFIIGKGLLEMMLHSQARETILSGAGEAKPSEAELAKQVQVATDQQIQSFVMQKFLVDSGNGNYKVTANFKAKKLMVNGQEMALPSLFEGSSSEQPPVNGEPAQPHSEVEGSPEQPPVNGEPAQPRSEFEGSSEPPPVDYEPPSDRSDQPSDRTGRGTH